MMTPSVAGERGVLYITWGDRVDQYLDRSIASLRLHHADLPVHIERIAEPSMSRPLREKARMGSLSPFKTTLYLDADTTVMGNLDFGFEQAERHGLACSICEAPWARRYEQRLADALEYNTGVIFFSNSATSLFDSWNSLADETPAVSRWTKIDNVVRGSKYDDQASFAAAIRQCRYNPFVLPINYNFRPEIYRSAFLPLKIWHDYIAPPAGLCRLSVECERAERDVTYVTFNVQNPSTPPPL